MNDPELDRIDREISQAEAALRENKGNLPGWDWRLAYGGLADWRTERKIVEAERALPHDVPAQWLRENYKPDDRIAVVMIGPKGHTIQRIDAAANFQKDNFQEWFRAQNAQGYNIHVSMSSLKPGAITRTKADVEHVRHIYLDLDHGGRKALDRILTTEGVPRPTSIVQSSPDKFQLHWRVKGFDKAEAERMMRGMAHEFGGDRAATDVARVMRVPGFLNRKEDYRANPPLVTLEHSEKPDKTRLVGPQSFPERFYREVERVRQMEQEKPTGPRLPGKEHGVSQSERDWAWVMGELEKGRDPGSLRSELEGRRQDKANPRDYSERTVNKAVAQFNTRHMERGQQQQEHRR
jgi:hypothetical protein